MGAKNQNFYCSLLGAALLAGPVVRSKPDVLAVLSVLRIAPTPSGLYAHQAIATRARSRVERGVLADATPEAL